MKEIETIYLCAFRYALGRKTYIVSIVVDFLMKQELTNWCKKKLIEEIEECNDYGMACDKESWMKLLDYLKN